MAAASSEESLRAWKSLIIAARRSLANEEQENTTPLEQSAQDFKSLIEGELPQIVHQNALIGDVLACASDIERLSPMVSRILADYAYQLVSKIDPTSEGRGVLQFKTYLYTILKSKKEDREQTSGNEEDVSALQNFYREYIEIVQDLEGNEGGDSEKRKELVKAYKNAQILGYVLKELSKTVTVKVSQQITQVIEKIEEKTQVFGLQKYNILPVDIPNPVGPIMELEEVKEAMRALGDVSGLPKQPNGSSFSDILEYLKFVFGFQNDNVRNQRENITLLVANQYRNYSSTPTDHMKSAIEEIFHKVLGNYLLWENYILLPNQKINHDDHSKKLLLLSLYFLIWGEAGNVRFLPEGLCFIFYNMALELDRSLTSATAEEYLYKSVDIENRYLERVIRPLYNILLKEAEYGGHGDTAKGHEAWRNYDDFNEFFWSSHCLKLTWPLTETDSFFTPPPQSKHKVDSSARDDVQQVSPVRIKRQSKTNFVEWRSFFHLYRSFHRVWIFLFTMFQALCIIAFGGNVTTMLTIFPTIAFLRFIEAFLDILLSWNSFKSMGKSNLTRKIVNLFVSGAWAGGLLFIVISVLESNSSTTQTITTAFAYLIVGIYLLPDFLVSFILSLSFIRKKTNRISDWEISRLFKWLYQEELYVGRKMYESVKYYFTYVFFWLILLSFKFTFSYYLQIKPLVTPTRQIINSDAVVYEWHSFISKNHSNTSSIISLWAPVVVIYLLDIQIWYTVLSAIGGGILGAKWHLGEIRSLGMIRARFPSFPLAFAKKMTPVQVSSNSSTSFSLDYNSSRTPKSVDRFAIAWNEIIYSLREEDYLSNKEVHSLLMPINNGSNSQIKWPLFLLANQIYLAIATALDKKDANDDELWEVINKADNNKYMRSSVVEVYHLIKSVLNELLSNGKTESVEQWILKSIYEEMEKSIELKNFVMNFRIKSLNQLHSKISDLTSILVQNQDDSKTAKAVSALQSLWETVKKDFLPKELKEKFENTLNDPNYSKHPFSEISWPVSQSDVKRLHSLLTMKESSVEIPKNLEARRRLEFFTNSLFMDIPESPPVPRMVPFCVMTPYYAEIVTYSKEDLSKENEDGITTLFYLQKIYPDEWQNFLERIGSKQRELEQKMRKDGEDLTDLRLWASYRGQTLTRTVRGMMYYRRALCLLAYLENEKLNDDLESGLQNYDGESTESKKLTYMSEEIRASVDLKYTYVVTCQIYGQQKLKKDPRAADIFSLMKNHEALRIAYIDEVEVNVAKDDKKNKKEYYSCLIKVDSLGQEQEIYRIKLPGMAKLGEGKPENQNHAIVFSRGEALQTIDMNQDNYLEEALKMRNLLQEFRSDHDIRKPTILGVREHIFTGSVSSLAWFMSNQETSFVTLGQRFLAYPLKVRMHYGHPDVFDRLFHITRGGISKASKTINISEDIYAGFNTTLRQGNVTHHEYIQVGKGRDVGLNQIALFEAKVSSGNGEQTLSRDVYRLGQRFDFFRMLSFWFTTVGYYTCTFLTVICVYFFLYGRLYLALSGVEKSLNSLGILSNNVALQSAINVQFLIQTGIFTAVPMIIGNIIEKGVLTAIISFITMQLQLASVFFTFSLGTRTHYFGRTILHGGAKYRSTGRGFVVHHEKFAEIYRLFSRSHFTKGLEVAMILTFYMVYGSSSNTITYILITVSAWFLAFSWCFAPFVFNPSGFEWQKTVNDFDDWTNWLFYHGGVGVKGDLSWEAWWDEEISHIKTLRSRILEIILSLRFFIFQFGVVYHLNVTNGDTSLLPYGISWGVLLVILLVFWIGSFGRTWDAQLFVRMLQSFLFLGSCGTLVFCFIFFDNLTVGDIFAGLLSFIPTGWGLLQIAVALKPVLAYIGLWNNIRVYARLYDALMGALLFLPLAILSWFPFVSTFQTRLLFNQAFSRGLEISLILAGNKKD